MRIFALYSPRPQSGKSTVAVRLADQVWVKTLKFAYPLKQMVATLLEDVLDANAAPVADFIDGPFKEAPIGELGGLTPRRLMQTLGTEWGRALDVDFWVRVMEARLNHFPPAGPCAVVDDMRFPNEYDMLKRRGALMVKIVRGAEHYEGTHASEGALDSHAFDVTIHNDGTLEDLYTQVDRLVK
jgi:hypothetical protein